MRKFLVFFSLCSLILVATSCHFNEELHLKADGSGKMSLNIDLAEITKMFPDNALDSLSGKKMDSVVHFKDLLKEKKDSIAKLPADQQEALKKLKNFSLRMATDDAKGEFIMDLFTNFEDINEVGDMMNAFKSVGSLDAKGESPIDKMGANGVEVHYGYKNNVFTRSTTVVDEALLKAQSDSLEEARMFLGGSKYTLKYHFPRRVKSVSEPTAMLSQDGKTVILAIDFIDYLQNPKILDLEVKLED